MPAASPASNSLLAQIMGDYTETERAALARFRPQLAALSKPPAGAVFNPGSGRWSGEDCVLVQEAQWTLGVAIPSRGSR